MPKKKRKDSFGDCNALVYVSAKSLQFCLIPFDPMDSSPPGSSVHGFSRQEYWSGLPFPSPDLPHPGIEPKSPVFPVLQVDSLPPSHRRSFCL